MKYTQYGIPLVLLAALSGCGSGNDNAISIDDPEPVLGAPEAVAGSPQPSLPGNRVNLDCSGSSTTNAIYQWRQTAGRQVVLENADRCVAHFIAPEAPGQLDFELTVTWDGTSVATKDITFVTVRHYSGRSAVLPANPFVDTLLSPLDTATAQQLYRYDDKLVVAEPGVLKIYDVSEMTPVAIAEVNFGGQNESLVRAKQQGRILQLRGNDEQLYVFDLSLSADQMLVSQVTLPENTDAFWREGMHLFTSVKSFFPDERIQLNAYGIQSDGSLNPLGNLNQAQTAAVNDVVVNNGIAYLGRGSQFAPGVLTRVDVSDPTNMQILDETSAGFEVDPADMEVAWISNMSLSGSTLIANDRLYRLGEGGEVTYLTQVEDVCSLSDDVTYSLRFDGLVGKSQWGDDGLQTLGHYTHKTPAPAMPNSQCVAYNQVVYYLDGQGIQAVDTQHFATAAVEFPSESGHVAAIAEDNNFAVLYDYSSQALFSFVPGSNPVFEPGQSFSSAEGLVAIAQGHVYQVADGTLSVMALDENGVTSPVGQQSIVTESTGTVQTVGIQVHHNKLYIVASGSSGKWLLVYDASQPQQPVQQQVMPLPAQAQGNIVHLGVMSDKLVVATGNYLFATTSLSTETLSWQGTLDLSTLERNSALRFFDHGNVYTLVEQRLWQHPVSLTEQGIDVALPNWVADDLRGFYYAQGRYFGTTNGETIEYQFDLAGNLVKANQLHSNFYRLNPLTATAQTETNRLYFPFLHNQQPASLVLSDINNVVAPGTVMTLDATIGNGQRDGVRCFVSGGDCSVQVLSENDGLYRITWNTPLQVGDYQLAVAAGNGAYSAIERAYLTVSSN